MAVKNVGPHMSKRRNEGHEARAAQPDAGNIAAGELKRGSGVFRHRDDRFVAEVLLPGGKIECVSVGA
jgi:hypothetical protein